VLFVIILPIPILIAVPIQLIILTINKWFGFQTIFADTLIKFIKFIGIPVVCGINWFEYNQWTRGNIRYEVEKAARILAEEDRQLDEEYW
jgi:hypothetical protein